VSSRLSRVRKAPDPSSSLTKSARVIAKLALSGGLSVRMKLLPILFALAAVPVLAADPAPAAAATAPAATPLAVGASAPKVSAKDQDGKTVNFADVYAKGTTLVYFYPKANTPGCTKQGCSLRDQWSELQAKGVQVLGVSGDKPEAQKAFRDQFSFPFPLIADDDGKVAAAFGVPAMKPGIFKRTSFLVKDGKIAWTMTDKTTTETHAADVLKAVASLK
jgi:peroxiredoxin Q/BCP